MNKIILAFVLCLAGLACLAEESNEPKPSISISQVAAGVFGGARLPIFEPVASVIIYEAKNLPEDVTLYVECASARDGFDKPLARVLVKEGKDERVGTFTATYLAAPKGFTRVIAARKDGSVAVASDAVEYQAIDVRKLKELQRQQSQQPQQKQGSHGLVPEE